MFLAAALLAAGCKAPPPAVQDLSGRQDLSQFKLHAIAGTRDGDRLHAQALFSDSSSMLMLDLQFAIGSPTRLEAGTWRWTRSGQVSSGAVAERSVTFLGGQDGPPSIGGTLDLLGADGAPHYRVIIPTSELKNRLKD